MSREMMFDAIRSEWLRCRSGVGGVRVVREERDEGGYVPDKVSDVFDRVIDDVGRVCVRVG